MDASKNGSNSRQRRHFSPQQKVAIVKEHLVDGVAISDLCDRHHLQPAQFYQWQKQLFENGAAAFERNPTNLQISSPPTLADLATPDSPRPDLRPLPHILGAMASLAKTGRKLRVLQNGS
jgi:transposase-like protein